MFFKRFSSLIVYKCRTISAIIKFYLSYYFTLQRNAFKKLQREAVERYKEKQFNIIKKAVEYCKKKGLKRCNNKNY